jgi:uncharacterized DUF497 family protein
MDAVSGFQWDDGNWPKCAKHGLSREEIEFVLLHKPMVAPDRTDIGEARFNAVGRTGEGRHVFVVFTVRRAGSDQVIRPISARYMHRKEVDHYERQRST